jgi:hypothetical protein
MDRMLCSSKDIGEEEMERVAENVLSRRRGRGALLTLDVGKLAFVYCHGQRPRLPRLSWRLSSFGLSARLLFQEPQGGSDDLPG